MTLHEAMVDVLRDRGGGWVDRDELAREIARRDLFRRPSDGAPPPSDQLRLRARRYSHLFECSDTHCTQIRLCPGGGAGEAGRGRLQMPTSRGHRRGSALSRRRLARRRGSSVALRRGQTVPGTRSCDGSIGPPGFAFS